MIPGLSAWPPDEVKGKERGRLVDLDDSIGGVGTPLNMQDKLYEKSKVRTGVFFLGLD